LRSSLYYSIGNFFFEKIFLKKLPTAEIIFSKKFSTKKITVARKKIPTKTSKKSTIEKDECNIEILLFRKKNKIKSKNSNKHITTYAHPSEKIFSHSGIATIAISKKNPLIKNMPNKRLVQ